MTTKSSHSGPPHSMTIDGHAVAGERRFGVINPATGTVFAEAPDCTRAELDLAMAAAERAFSTWRSDEPRRRRALKACAAVIQAGSAELADLLTREQGKPLGKALSEVQGAAYWFKSTAELELPAEVLQDDAKARIELRRKPVGVVAAITPWNFPVILAVWKIAPALLAGNTLVLKPSPFTPLSSLKLGAMLAEVLPAGVLNVVSGGDELGAWLSGHPTVRRISFTGSVATGKKIAAAAAPDLKRYTLELGGNDPAIVLKDVDPKKTAQNLFWGAFSNSGQICTAIKRLYVEEEVYQPIVDELVALAKSVRMGDGLDPATQLGPLNNRPQLERVTELVDDAVRSGGHVLSGGQRLESPGYFYPATLVTNVAEGARLVDEEQFGPALPILPFTRIEDALERANRSHFGLGGSIWTSNVERGIELASQLECGVGWVNQHMALGNRAPFGGMKWSGIGYANGKWGLEAYTEMQVINVAK